jgi:polyisoprenoid-binding protein YceI
MGRPPRLSVALWIAAAVVGLVALGWTFVAGGDPPARAGLPEPLEVALPAGGTAPDRRASAEGEWVVEPGEGVFVGYRATESWAAERFSKAAVGRTPAVAGRLRIEEGRLEAAEVTADLTRLASDQSARDAYLRREALETDRYPQARFRLTAAVELPDPPVPGDVVRLTVRGDLTLHGTTREVTAALEARWNGGSIDVAGAAEIGLGDFGIDPPRTPFIEVDEVGEFEFQLRFRPA